MPKFSRRAVSNAQASAREICASEFVPYKYQVDRETIYTKEGDLLQIIKVNGFSFETADDEDIDIRKLVRNSLWKSLAQGSFSLWFHTVRRRQTAYPGGKMPEGFAKMADDMWRKKHMSRHSFVNELYVTIIRREEKSGTAAVDNFLNKFAAKNDEGVQLEQMKEARKQLSEAVYRVLATLKDYGARVLTTRDTEYGSFSEPLEFLSYLINGGVKQPVVVPTMELAKFLPSCRTYFGSSTIEYKQQQGSRFGAIVMLKEYAPATAAGMLDAFLQLPVEFVIAQCYVFENRAAKISQMQTKQRRMKMAEDKAVGQVQEIDLALELAMSGNVAFGEHQLTVQCYNDNLKGLEQDVSMAFAELVNLGVNPTREKSTMEMSFWSQLPANFKLISRPATIHTLNLAAFVSLHNYPVGKIAGNHWGDAVTVFNTTSGTPYFFNFHSRDVGHTTIIGPTGAGKTVLMNFLVVQTQKFNCRVFMFDKDRGADIFVRALGGNYSIVDPGKNCGFNPLKLPDTPENRSFLFEWIITMIGVYDEPINSEDLQRVQEAVNGNYKLQPKDRVLRNIVPFLGLETPGSIASRFKIWHSGGQYARVFDNDEDNIDFTSNRMFGFEMGPLLADKKLLTPALLYMFHRINLSLDGTPTLIILDEAWALIDNQVFASKIKDWLKTLRKLNGSVVFATQSVEDAANSSISDTLIQQTGTQIFLPNPKATEVYKTAFMVSDREFNLLKKTDPGSRFFLVKQGSDAVIAKIDLSGMDDVIRVLSGRAETVGYVEQLIEEVGNDPKLWLPLYLKRLRDEAEQ
jgi:type IV secretion system protein VirB4